MIEFTRSFPLEDIQIRSGGSGRTVEAYAAVFGTEVPISDRDGQYREKIDPSAFKRTLASKGTQFGVLYNHGMTIHGTPSDIGSMPIGTPIEVRADGRGLLTVTEYNKTPLGEATLEAIKAGSLRSQSFAGAFTKSDKRGPFRADRNGNLPLVTRQEINLREYGPTPFPAYSDALIMGVRAQFEALFSTLEDELDPEQERAAIADIFGVSPDDTAELLARLSPLTSLATRLASDPAGVSATPSDEGPGTDDPPARHSARNVLSKRSREILAAYRLEGN